MDHNDISKKAFLCAIGIALIILLIILVRSYLFSYTRIVFCDVGQGDGTYIRTKDKIDIIIDAGPDGSMATCLGKYMPFFDRAIELAFLTHPHHDHYGGFESILSHYSIEKFVTTPIDNENESFNDLKKTLTDKHVEIINLYRGDKITLAPGEIITFIWPTKTYIAANSTNVTSNDQNSSNVLGAFTSNADLNELSEAFIFSEGRFNILFTGDASSNTWSGSGLDSINSDLTDLKNNLGGTYHCNNTSCLSSPNRLEILKVPHHGSKTGLTSEFLKLADPMLSVISVAQKNKYGHPSKQVLDMYRALKLPLMMTKDNGDVIITLREQLWDRRGSRISDLAL